MAFTPTFTGLDVGLPGGALYTANKADSKVSIQPGGVQAVRAEFALPGMDGVFAHSFGLRGREMTWNLLLRMDVAATLDQIEQSIAGAMKAGEGTMTDTHGLSYPRTILTAHRPGAKWYPIRGGDRDGWIGREDQLVFKVLT